MRFIFTADIVDLVINESLITNEHILQKIKDQVNKFEKTKIIDRTLNDEWIYPYACDILKHN